MESGWPRMLSRALTASTYGVNAVLIEVETNLDKQIPGFSIVGLPDNTVRESRERISAAIRNCGYEFPHPQDHDQSGPGGHQKRGVGIRCFDGDRDSGRD